MPTATRTPTATTTRHQASIPEIPFPPQVPLTNMSDNPFLDALRLRAATSNMIRTANTDMPEQNGGVVTISTITEVPHGDFYRVAYCLSINADLRYTMDESKDWYRAYVYGTDQVLLLFPSQPYTDMHTHENYTRGRVIAKEDIEEDHARHLKSETTLRNGVLANADRQITVACFKFDQLLDNTVLSPDAVNNAIKVRIVPNVADDGTTNGRAKVFFMVALHDDDPPRTNKPKPAAAENQLSQLVKKMNLKNGAP